MSNQKKRREKQSKRRSHPVVPDEFFAAGPLHMARFGKVVMFDKTMTKEAFAKETDRLSQSHEEICAEIDNHVARVVEIIAGTKVVKLLQRAHWELARKAKLINDETDIGLDELNSLRMLDYVQSVAAAVSPNRGGIKEPSEETWANLQGHVRKVFDLVNLPYHITKLSTKRMYGETIDQDYEDYYFMSQLYWMNVRGNGYTQHDAGHFRDLLSPHSDVFESEFGVSVNDVITGYQRIQDALMLGFTQAMHELYDLWNDTAESMKYASRLVAGVTSPEEQLRGVFGVPEFATRREELASRLSGLDLYDVECQTAWPREFLTGLSWQLGEEMNFLAEGPYRGWPLRIWPIFTRPFLAVDDKFYCFDIYSLRENFYRVLQRLICCRQPTYKEKWNKRQKVVAETLSFKLIDKLLPTASVHQAIHYPWKTGAQQQRNWCECDGFVEFDDNLLIVEVKAGAFTRLAPTTDFPTHNQSLKALLEQPSDQGRRFLDYLRSNEEVPVFNKEHREIRKLRLEFVQKRLSVCGHIG